MFIANNNFEFSAWTVTVCQIVKYQKENLDFMSGF